MRHVRHIPWLLAILLAPAAFSQHATITAEEVEAWQQDGDPFLFIDVRQPHRYDRRHAAGAMNVPALACATRTLPPGRTIVVYDDGTGSTESARAADALVATGHEVYVLEGGLTAWEALRRPVVGIPGNQGDPFVGTVGADDVLRLIDGQRAVAVFDVRPAESFAAGRIPGAVAAPKMRNLLDAVDGREPTDLIVLVDDGEGLALKLAEQLRRRGFRAVKIVYGGMPAWQEKGLRIEK